MNYAYTLYAVTQEKKLAERFRKERNMDCFIERCSKMDDEKGEELLVTARSKLLMTSYIPTSLVNNRGQDEERYAKMTFTSNEWDYVMEGLDTDQILNLVYDYIPINLFTPDLGAALMKLNYTKAYLATNGDEGPGQYEFDYDELGAFLYIYQKYYKPEFISNIKLVTREDVEGDTEATPFLN